MTDFLALLVFILPAYFANATPVVLGGGKPLDGGALFSDGRPLLGPSKTIRGFVAGVAAGVLSGALLAFYVPLPFFSSHSLHLLASSSLAFGTMLGDAVGSFLKRRLNIPSGKPFWPDTVVFLAIALLLAYPFTSSALYAPVPLVFLFGVTMVLHPLSNMLANRLGWKKVPW